MRTITAYELKDHGPAVLDALEPEGVIVTRDGEPVAKIIPWPRPSRALIGSLESQIQIHGDILSTGVPWDAES